MSDTPSNALFLAAAIAVIIFSVVGVGVMTGIIPTLAPKGETKNSSSNHVTQALCTGCARIEQVSLQNAAQQTLAREPAAEPAGAPRYEVVVRLADGSARVYSYAAQPEFRVGDTVRIEGEKLRAE